MESSRPDPDPRSLILMTLATRSGRTCDGQVEVRGSEGFSASMATRSWSIRAGSSPRAIRAVSLSWGASRAARADYLCVPAWCGTTMRSMAMSLAATSVRSSRAQRVARFGSHGRYSMQGVPVSEEDSPKRPRIVQRGDTWAKRGPKVLRRGPKAQSCHR